MTNQEDTMFENDYSQLSYSRQHLNDLLRGAARDRLAQIARGERRPVRPWLRMALRSLVALARTSAMTIKPVEATPDRCCSAAACC